jgi:valyl-tRNA synthetase
VHPFTPFISEEIWQRVAPLAGVGGKTIMRQPYPSPDQKLIDPAALDEIGWVRDIIAGVRKIRSGMNIDPRKTLPVLLQGGSDTDHLRMKHNLHYLTSVGRIESVTWLDPDTAAPESSTTLVGNMKLLIPLAGLIDKEAELTRLARELTRKKEELDRCEKKLANSGFTDKAPEDVVAREQERASELADAIKNLQSQQEKIQTL